MLLQHLVVAGLDGDLDVRHDLGQAGDGVEQLIGHPVGVGGEEADALEAFDLVQADRAGRPGSGKPG